LQHGGTHVGEFHLVPFSYISAFLETTKLPQ